MGDMMGGDAVQKMVHHVQNAGSGSWYIWATAIAALVLFLCLVFMVDHWLGFVLVCLLAIYLMYWIITRLSAGSSANGSDAATDGRAANVWLMDSDGIHQLALLTPKSSSTTTANTSATVALTRDGTVNASAGVATADAFFEKQGLNPGNLTYAAFLKLDKLEELKEIYDIVDLFYPHADKSIRIAAGPYKDQGLGIPSNFFSTPGANGLIPRHLFFGMRPTSDQAQMLGVDFDEQQSGVLLRAGRPDPFAYAVPTEEVSRAMGMSDGMRVLMSSPGQGQELSMAGAALPAGVSIASALTAGGYGMRFVIPADGLSKRRAFWTLDRNEGGR